MCKDGKRCSKMTDLYIHRVSYGKESIPIKDREYRWGNSPVGNREEWLKFAREHGYDGVWFTEKDGNSVRLKAKVEE